MNNKKIKLLHKYKELSKEDLINMIKNIVKIKEQILFQSSILDLCEYLSKLERIKNG